MRNDSVKLTTLGETIYLIGIGLSGAVVLFGGIRLFGLLVVKTAQLLGLV